MQRIITILNSIFFKNDSVCAWKSSLYHIYMYNYARVEFSYGQLVDRTLSVAILLNIHFNFAAFFFKFGANKSFEVFKKYIALGP